MNLPLQKSPINSIFNQKSTQNTNPNNIFNRDNKNTTISPMNVFQNIRINQTNPYRKSQPTVNIFAKKVEQPSKPQLQKSENILQNDTNLQVKVMFDDRMKSNTYQRQQILKQKLKKIKEEGQLKRNNRQRQQQNVETFPRETYNDVNQNQNHFSLIQNSANSNNQNNLIQFEIEIPQKNEPYSQQKKQSDNETESLQRFPNGLETIRQQSLQESAIKPKNNLISSTHSHDSRLQYFDNISQSDQQSNQKPKSNTLRQQDYDPILLKSQIKMTDSLRLMNQIKQTSSYGVMSKTSNSLKSQIIKHKPQVAYELQTKKIESQSQSSDNHSELSSSRILQKKQTKDAGQDLTKSQKVLNKKIQQNQNQTTKSHLVKQVKQQGQAPKVTDHIREFEIVQEKQINPKQKIIKNEKEKRKASGSSSQQLQPPKTLSSNISFGPQSFLNVRQKINSNEPKGNQIKAEQLIKNNQNIQPLQYKSIPNRQNNMNNIYKGTIFQGKPQPPKTNIFNKKSQPYKKVQQIPISNDLKTTNNMFKAQNLLSQQQKKEIVPILSQQKETQKLPSFNIRSSQESEDDQKLPCFNTKRTQQKRQENNVPKISKVEDHKTTQAKNIFIQIKQNKQIPSNNNPFHLQSPLFQTNQTKNAQQSNLQKQKISMKPLHKKDQSKAISNYSKQSNYYVQKNYNYMQRILEICDRKKQMFKKMVNFHVFKTFEDQYMFLSEKVFPNKHNICFLLNLSQKLQTIKCKATKQQTLLQKTKNYIQQLVILKKSFQRIQLAISKPDLNKNQSFLGKNKYTNTQRLVPSQKTKQTIQKMLLKHQLYIKEKQIQLKKVQKKLESQYSNNKDSDESSEDDFFIEDFAFGYKPKLKQKVKQETLIKKSNNKLKMYNENQLINLKSIIKGENYTKKRQSNRNSKTKIISISKNTSPQTTKTNKCSLSIKTYSSNLQLKKMKSKIFMFKKNEDRKLKLKDRIQSQQYKKNYHLSLENTSQELKANDFINTYQQIQQASEQTNHVFIEDKWEIELTEDVSQWF